MAVKTIEEWLFNKSTNGSKKGLSIPHPVMFDTCLDLCQSKVCNVEKTILYKKEHMVHPCQKKKKKRNDKDIIQK